MLTARGSVRAGQPAVRPSAGVAIATAMTSLATGIPVRSDVAMTGEVTLRGRVLPVGGVCEKALAALRSGIKTVVIPASNVGDLREIPEEVQKQLTFLPVRNMREVLGHVLVTPPVWLEQTPILPPPSVASPTAHAQVHARRRED